MKRLLIILALIVPIAVFTLVFSVNFFSLTKPMTHTLKSDPRNDGIAVSVQYRYFVDRSSIVIDINTVSYEKSPADVFRVLLQYASAIKDLRVEKVYLSSKGIEKFYLDGSYFRKLGQEYGLQNPVYTMRTFTENVYTLEGERAFASWSGGILGVAAKQIEDFSDFHSQWYVLDQ